MKVIEIIHQLRTKNGRNYKLDVLKQHKDNYSWLRFLKATYDPYTSYYVSPPKANDFNVVSIDEAFHTRIGFLSDRVYAGKEAKKYAEDISKVYGEPGRLVLERSIKAGVSVKSINAAYPNLIPTWDIMKGEKNIPTAYPCWSSIKYDGVRLTSVKTDDGVTLHTSSGRPVHIHSVKRSVEVMPNGVFDGELVHGDGRTRDRTSISGSLNKCLTGTKDDIPNCSFMAFDFIELDQWIAKDTDPYERRLRRLNDLLWADGLIKPVAQNVLASDDQANQYFTTLIEDGWEGFINRYPSDPYIFGRSGKMIKKKMEAECILVCFDTVESIKRPGEISGLRCKGKVKDPTTKQEVYVEVTLTHLDDYHRGQPHEYFIGKEIEGEFNSVVHAEGNEHPSLFLPNFKRIVGGA